MTILSTIGAIAFIALTIFPGTYLGTMVAFGHSSDKIIGKIGRWISFVVISCVTGFIATAVVALSPVIWIASRMLRHTERHWYKGYSIIYNKELKRWVAYDETIAIGSELNARQPEDLMPAIEEYIGKISK